MNIHRIKILFLCLFLIFNCTKEDKVKKIISNEALIISFDIGNVMGEIIGTNIFLKLPLGTDKKTLSAVVEISPKASISPDPTQNKDYTNPVTFTVTAQDGTTIKDYTVVVAPNNEANIISWKFEDKVANIQGTDIKIKLAYGTDITALKANVKLSPGATISPDPANNIDYTNLVNFKVTAEDGNTTKDYKVTVNVEDPIISWTAGWRDSSAYKAIINQGTVKIDVNSADFDTKVTLLAGVTISPDPNSVADWTDEVTFTARKGSIEEEYKVKVTVNDKDIIKVTNFTELKNIMDGKDTGDFNYIDVSSVTDMQMLFMGENKFNGDITKWDVSNVTNMQLMFHEADVFNQDIGKWDVSKVTNMEYMFFGTETFDRNIGGWDVSRVESIKNMFNRAKVFNQDIGGWDVSSVKDMKSAFLEAKAFNQDISRWDVSNVKDCYNFSNASSFSDSHKPNFKDCN